MPTSLAAKLKFDGFRSGFAPLAAFPRSSQLVQPDSSVFVPATPALSHTSVEEMAIDAELISLPSPLPVEDMALDEKPSQAAANTKSSATSTSPSILRKIGQITKQFVNLQIQSPPAPVEISPLVQKMARLGLNDKQQTSKAQITESTSSARSRQTQPQVESQPISSPAPPPRTDFQTASRQPSSAVPARPSGILSERHRRRKAKTEKKQVTFAPAPAQPSSSATPKPIPKSTAPTVPQRPAGQLSLPSAPSSSLFAAARKPLAQVSPPKSTSPSSSVQPSSAKATAIPATAEKKEPTPTASSSQPLTQPVAPTQTATPSPSGQSSSAPAQASAPKTETKKLAAMGAVDSSLATMLDSFEAEETKAKAEKAAPKLAPKPEPKPEPKPAAEAEHTPSFEELESQLALEELDTLMEEKQVTKFKGKGRKIAPLKRK